VDKLFTFLPVLGKGLGVTLGILAPALVLALAAAFTAGLARRSENLVIRKSASIYIEFFRGTSVLVQLYWVFFVLPFFGIRLTPFWAAVITQGLHIGAYGAEVVRGAVNAVPAGQWEAARSLNFSPFTTMRYIILPQAVVAMLPTFSNLVIELLKSTALVSLITVSDLTYQGKILINTTLETARIFLLILVIYFIIAQILSRLVRALEMHLSRGMDYGGLQ
jgi:polar amino acid transport system permease protein